MSELVYIRNNHGGADVQVWHGPPYLGMVSLTQTNALGNLATPSAGGTRIIKRIPIKDGEEKLGLNQLKLMYPLEEKK